MRRVLMIIALISLTGCAEKSRFDCPYGKGPSCLSMGEIDKNIKSNATSTVTCTKTSCGKPDKKPVAAAVTHATETDANPALRVPETVLQMWVSPYEASSGIYYQASYANIIVKDAAWQAPVLDDLSGRDTHHD